MMRITSTVSVSRKDLWQILLIIVVGTFFLLYVMLILTSRHRTEQAFGAKTAHRQRGLSVLKEITNDIAKKQKSKLKIVDPPVNAANADTNARELPEDEEVELDKKTEDIRRVYPEEYALRGLSKMTSYSNSFYRINGDRENIRLGDTLHVTIHARDGWNRDRNEGGDFWFATLATKRNSSGTAGRVIDHDNGTYSVYFTVGWSGLVTLEIMLVHPSQVAALLINVIWNERDRVEWVGRFETEVAHGSVRSDVQKCVLRRQYASLLRDCVMTYPDVMGQTVIVCDAPSSGIPCKNLAVLKGNMTAVNQRIRSITRDYYNVFAGNRFKRRLVRGPSKLIIKESQQLREKLLAAQDKLPACQPDLTPPEHGQGYWEKNAWHSLLCKAKTRWDNPREIGNCFKGIELYFLGDSTARHWLEELSGLLGNPFKRRTSKEYSTIDRQFPVFNASLFYRMHPLTLDPNGTRFEDLAFEVNVLNSLDRQGCNYVVAVSFWADFFHWTRESYLEYTELLNEAASRLKARCPDVPIVVAGPRPREQPSRESRIYHSDVITHWMAKIQKDVFSQSGVFFLDRWDMALGYPTSKRLDMPRHVILDELSMFLSYVCNKLGKYS